MFEHAEPGRADRLELKWQIELPSCGSSSFVLRLSMTTRGEQNDLDLEADLFGFELADPCAVNTAPSSGRALVTAS